MHADTASTLPMVDDYTTERVSHSGRVVATTYSPRTLDDRYLVPSELGEVLLPDFEPRSVGGAPDPALDTWDSELDASIEPVTLAAPPPRRGWGALVAFVAGAMMAGAAVAATLFAGVLVAGLLVVGLLVAEQGPESTFIIMPENRGNAVEAPADSLPATDDEGRSDGTFFVMPENRGN